MKQGTTTPGQPCLDVLRKLEAVAANLFMGLSRTCVVCRTYIYIRDLCIPFCSWHDTPHHQVFCGYEHTFALTSDGDVLGFGNGVKGQLGIGNTGKYIQ